jgi:hypothetical protein
VRNLAVVAPLYTIAASTLHYKASIALRIWEHRQLDSAFLKRAPVGGATNWTDETVTTASSSCASLWEKLRRWNPPRPPHQPQTASALRSAEAEGHQVQTGKQRRQACWTSCADAGSGQQGLDSPGAHCHCPCCCLEHCL